MKSKKQSQQGFKTPTQKNKKFFLFFLVGVLIILFLIILFFNKQKIEKACFSKSKCELVYSCCGGWKCQTSREPKTDCSMFCNKPSIEESKFKCVCENFKCKLIEKEQDYCEKDSDCLCGKNKNTGVCGFWGKNFAEISKECGKFCGIPGGSMCIENKCGGSILN